MLQKSFPHLVDVKIKKARAKHRGIQSRHEAVAVILEEFDEFKEAVFRDKSAFDVLDELVQVAAMCQRAAEDLGMTAAGTIGE